MKLLVCFFFHLYTMLTFKYIVELKHRDKMIFGADLNVIVLFAFDSIWFCFGLVLLVTWLGLRIGCQNNERKVKMKEENLWSKTNNEMRIVLYKQVPWIRWLNESKNHKIPVIACNNTLRCRWLITTFPCIHLKRARVMHFSSFVHPPSTPARHIMPCHAMICTVRKNMDGTAMNPKMRTIPRT